MSKTLTLFNVLEGKKQAFVPIDPKCVGIYTCGPTVYNYVHIGNLRTFLVEDILVKTLNYMGYPTLHIMNFTDVDDKTIKKSIAEGRELLSLTKEYEEAFLKDIEKLGFKKADHYPRATDFIPQMIECIKILIDKGFAYVTDDGSVYYSIGKFKDYGKLSKIKKEELVAGASDRVLLDEYDKEHAGDFVLWKAAKPEDGNNYWESPWGNGRPGWHLECSVMSYEYLGRSFDIHCGGIDNKFPHHENEIAQSIAAYGGDFAHYFVHIWHLKLEHNKMSKSLGNVIYLNNLLEAGVSTKILRYALLTAHYRQELVFNDGILYQAEEALSRIWGLIEELKIKQEQKISYHVSCETQKIIQVMEEKFEESILDDLNIPKAMGFIFSAVKDFNKNLSMIDSKEAEKILSSFKKLDQICGFLVPNEKTVPTLTSEQLDLLEARKEARKNKNFEESDRIRDLLLSQGVEVKDTKDGQIYKIKY